MLSALLAAIADGGSLLAGRARSDACGRGCQLIAGTASLLRFDVSFFWPINMFGMPLGELLEELIGLAGDLIGNWKETIIKLLIVPFLEALSKVNLEGWDHLDINIFKLLEDGSKALLTFNALLNFIKPVSVVRDHMCTSMSMRIYLPSCPDVCHRMVASTISTRRWYSWCGPS